MTSTNTTNTNATVRNREAELVKLSMSITEHISEYNQALKDNDFKAMSEAEAALKKAEADYAAEKMYMVFSQLKELDNPIEGCIRQHSFFTVGHKVSRKDGNIVGFERVEAKPRQLDLLKLADYCDIKPKWWGMVQKFNQLMCLRAAEELHMSEEEKAC